MVMAVSPLSVIINGHQPSSHGYFLLLRFFRQRHCPPVPVPALTGRTGYKQVRNTADTRLKSTGWSLRTEVLKDHHLSEKEMRETPPSQCHAHAA